MGNMMLLSSILVLALSACAQPIVGAAQPSAQQQNDGQQALGKKCKDAKYQFDKTVEEGQTSDLRELKRNIELHCVWRRN